MKERQSVRKELEKEMRRITSLIISHYAPEQILLFGSLANGEVDESSDIDLVIVKDTKERFIDRLHRVRLITRPEAGVDFFVYTPEEIKTMAQRKNKFLLTEILGKGQVLYERNKQMVSKISEKIP